MSYLSYLKALEKPIRKRVYLDFLQADQKSVAFTVGSGRRDSAAFVQDGSISVSLQNGERRKANIVLSGLDERFKFNANKIWFGNTVRLRMGIALPGGGEYVLPMGVFYFDNPQEVFNPSQKTVTYDLVDKWCALDGKRYGAFDTVYEIKPMDGGGNAVNIFDAARNLLRLNKSTFDPETVPGNMIDPISPVFTAYYNGQTYTKKDGTTVPMLNVPHTIRSDANNGTIADLMIDLTDCVTGLCGYDAAGAFRITPAQDGPETFPVLFTFTPQNSILSGLQETANAGEVYNDIIVTGETLDDYECWGRAENDNFASDTNIALIGRRTKIENQASYWNAKQCEDYAGYLLREQAILRKQITISCNPVYHLYEGGIVLVQRTDKPGAPYEKHRINSFTIPLGEGGAMTVNATSAADFDLTFKKSNSED